MTRPDPHRGSGQLVDSDEQQRFLLTSRRPPVHVQGRTFPPEQRQGPDDGSYLIFNGVVAQLPPEAGGAAATTSSGLVRGREKALLRGRR